MFCNLARKPSEVLGLPRRLRDCHLTRNIMVVLECNVVMAIVLQFNPGFVIMVEKRQYPRRDSNAGPL